MIRRTAMLVVFVLCGLAALAKAPSSFFTTWEDVQQSAKKRHVLIYLHFTTDWCKWCRKIEAETYTDEAVKKELASDFACASLDCTETEGKDPSPALKTNMALFQEYGGTGYPLLVILSEDGAEVFQTIGGYLPADQFLQRLLEAMKTQQDYLTFQAYTAKADTTTYEYALRALRMDARVYRKADTIAMAKQVRTLDPDNAKGDALEAAWAALKYTPEKQWATDGKDYLTAISRFDADNAKRYLEQASWAQAISAFDRKEFPACIAALTGLLKTAKTLADEQDVYGLLGVAYHENGTLDKSITYLKIAIKFNPTSELGKWLQQKLDAFQHEGK